MRFRNPFRRRPSNVKDDPTFAEVLSGFIPRGSRRAKTANMDTTCPDCGGPYYFSCMIGVVYEEIYSAPICLSCGYSPHPQLDAREANYFPDLEPTGPIEPAAQVPYVWNRTFPIAGSMQ